MLEWTIVEGDSLHEMAGMAPGSIDAIVTSPPYADQRHYDGGGTRGTYHDLAARSNGPELFISLLLSRDKMHHSVGWWRNADYEYCWHLSICARTTFQEAAPNEDVPREDVRLWARAIFGEHTDKVWNEPGGTDPRLSLEERRANARFWHLRLFLNPLLLDTRGEPHVPFLPTGEVYHLTRWIDGLTPPKVDR